MLVEFVCPKCRGRLCEIWALNGSNPGIRLMYWHLILNPGLAFNELVLGQRFPERLYICKSCTDILGARTYIHCYACDTFHENGKWAGKRAFGNWLGYVCPKCGSQIPCLWNVTSRFLLLLSWPVWYLPVKHNRARWLSAKQQEMIHVLSGVSAESGVANGGSNNPANGSASDSASGSASNSANGGVSNSASGGASNSGTNSSRMEINNASLTPSNVSGLSSAPAQAKSVSYIRMGLTWGLAMDACFSVWAIFLSSNHHHFAFLGMLGTFLSAMLLGLLIWLPAGLAFGFLMRLQLEKKGDKNLHLTMDDSCPSVDRIAGKSTGENENLDIPNIDKQE